jgi:hypothetical protein
VTTAPVERHIGPMSNRIGDTDAQALAVLTELYRNMEPEEKLARVRDLTIAAGQLAMAGLRARHPGEREPQLLLRLARLRLGDRLVAEAYGTDPSR